MLLLWRTGLLQQLNFENLKARQEELRAWTGLHFWRAVMIYFSTYVVVTAAALPGAGIMTLAGGAIFGLTTGVITVSFASTIGATLCFLGSRYFLRDFVAEKFKSTYDNAQNGLQKEGAFYLFTLRMMPVVPFFVINLVFGLMRMKPRTFFWVSQVAMLPATFAFVNAGTRLSQIESMSGIISWPVILSFALLGTVPWIAKLILESVRRYRIYDKFTRPSKFDYDVIVIGGGAAGLVSAYITAALKGKVLLIEKSRMGGDCLYTGCVPSKALLRSAHVASLFRRGDEFGLQAVVPQVDFSKVFTRIHNIIEKIEPNDSVERYASLGVECLTGEAKIADPFRVHVDKKILTTRNIIVATGAAPLMPEIPGLKEVPYYTSDTLWDMKWVPKKLLILGGGPIGCELGQAFARLSCDTTLVEKSARLLMKEDPDVSAMIHQRLGGDALKIILNNEVLRFEKNGAGGRAWLRTGESIDFDGVIMALGRRAHTRGFGLQELGIACRANDTIETDEYLRTRFPNILACGDVTGPFQFTHAASHQAGYAVLNALFAPFKSFKADYSALPWCTFTEPEVARVGLNELMAHENGEAVDIHTYPLDHLDRAICEGENFGMVKVLTRQDSGKILGVTVVGPHAGESIAEFVLAMRKNLSLNDILNTVHSYPTFTEANRFVAGIWKKKSAPKSALRFLEWFHGWRRA